MEENIWNNQRFRFLQKSDNKDELFNNTKQSYRYFNTFEQEDVEEFVDRNKCDFVVLHNLECQLTRYFVEEKDEDEDDFIVHRLASKIILN